MSWGGEDKRKETEFLYLNLSLSSTSSAVDTLRPRTVTRPIATCRNALQKIKECLLVQAETSPRMMFCHIT